MINLHESMGPGRDQTPDPWITIPLSHGMTQGLFDFFSFLFVGGGGAGRGLHYLVMERFMKISTLFLRSNDVHYFPLIKRR